MKYNYQYRCQSYQIDLYVLSIAEPIAVDDCIDKQIRNSIERLNKASADVAKNYKAVIEEKSQVEAPRIVSQGN